MDNGLSKAQVERLALLAEECGEVVQAVGKILRFGYDSRCPVKGITNTEHLATEIGDLMAAVNLLTESRDVNVMDIGKATLSKPMKYRTYTFHQGELILP